MQKRPFYLACLLICLAVMPALAQSADPLSGTWTGDWGPTATHRNPVTVELKWDGKALTGVVNPGPQAVALLKASFDPKTGAVNFEADADNHGAKVHFVIQGKVEKGTMTGSWNHDNRKGDFRITKK
jgi:hypothetical protein